jgi:hypothetical protein
MNSADTKQAKQQIEENQAEARLQAHRLALEINGKFMKSKAAYTVEVKTKQAAIEGLQAQLDHLKQELDGRTPDSWSNEVKEKDSRIKKLGDERDAALSNVERLQKDIERIRESSEQSCRQKDNTLHENTQQIMRLTEEKDAAHRSAESLQQGIREAARQKDLRDRATQEETLRKSREVDDQLRSLETRLTAADSAKRAVESKLNDLEKHSTDQAQQWQKETAELRLNLDNANNALKDSNDRVTEQQKLVIQKDLIIDGLKRDHAKTALNSASDHVQDSQAQGGDETQTSTMLAKQPRRAVNRNNQTVPRHVTAVPDSSQSTTGHQESMQSKSAASSIFGPFSKTRRDDDDMLDLDFNQLQFSKGNSLPDTLQPDFSHRLGSQEILDAEGVRFRSQAARSETHTQTQAETQSHLQTQLLGKETAPHSSSSLSETRDLDDSYEEAAQTETQASQRSRHLYTVEATPQRELGGSQQSDLESPPRTGGKKVQGVGKKLATPSSVRQQSSHGKAGALQPVSALKMAQKSMGSEKKMSALSSGPRNFKTPAPSKSKRVSYADEDYEDDVDWTPSSGQSSRSTLKRTVTENTGSSKKRRTEASTSSGSSGQRSGGGTARRSQSLSKSSASSSSVQETPKSRRSSRSSK